MATGSVILMKPDSGYGLIKEDADAKVYLFFCKTGDFAKGDAVTYDIAKNGRFPEVIHVQKAGE
ncbi:MAG: hypothetical protein P4N59_17950 [Negativicutes bacterium]|nr:hypothetical protein [Negativicutes bacterium]